MKNKDSIEEQKRLIRRLQSFNEKLRFLHQISQKISEKKIMQQLLCEIMESSKLLMRAEASSLLLFQPEDGRLHFLVATGDKGEIVKPFSIALGEGIAGWVAKEQKPAIVDDCYKDPRFNPEYDKKSKFRTRSMICVPMVKEGTLIGVIQVINKEKGRVFDSEDLFLFETLASQCTIAIENHRLTERQVETEVLERELKTAREIQQNLLPKSLPDLGDLEAAALIIPAKMVGGDYYNIYRIGESRSLFLIADASGKGIPAALIVSTLDASLNSFFKMNSGPFDLLEMVGMLNRVLLETTTPSQFATAWFGLYDHTSGDLTSVNAGHNWPYLLRETKEAVPLEKGGVFLGGIVRPYESETVRLIKDDILVFYTDGITEAWNGREAMYGDERLIRTLCSHRRKPAKAILAKVEEDVKRHVGKAPQSDDITCVVIKKR